VTGTQAQKPIECSLGQWSRTAAGHPGSVLLWTARLDSENQSSFLFTEPLQILSTRRLDEIPAIFASIEDALRKGFHVAGFLSYEAGYHFEPAALRHAAHREALNPLLAQLPLIWFGIYREPLVLDEPGRVKTGRILSRGETQKAGDVSVDISQAEYCRRVQQIRQWIEAGDFYQANFTINVRQPWTEGAAALFERIMENQSVPYGALIHAGNTHILSASPELFFRRQGSRITVRPMKGTAHRGRDSEEDAQMAAWLTADEKNRAENIMIVDLMRNDLGRICSTGSVQVSDLFAVERYPALLQMTSTVKGELKPATSCYEIFRSLFPCGSITGAPKVRTMQAIRELEGEPRGIACGAIGFFSPGGDAVFSVAIRTLTLQNQPRQTQEVQMRVGSGITHDSDPAAEYEECLLKSRFLTRTLPQFELIETMAWDKDFVLLDLHLKRLQKSAEYFDFPIDPGRTRTELYQFAKGFEKGTRHRVRLLLARSGSISISSTPLSPVRNPALLLLSSTRVDSQDVFLRHKTTHRSIQDGAFAQAQTAGCDDALLLNSQGQVTECAIHNVMIAKDGKFITPPLECGLLPGVYRQHLLAMHPEIEVAAFTLEDLLAADSIFIFNSVRGLRRAQIAPDTSRTQKLSHRISVPEKYFS
jgi:para-aminobenzoate synthetase/4-amino-4-deoxychorismate lyase